MPRRYYYRRRMSSGKDKYSIEQNTFRMNVLADPGQGSIVCVPSTTVQGMRKVKHLTITLSNVSGSNTVYWALVYVPEGYTPNNLLLPNVNSGGAFYEPNQFVMNAGCVDCDAGPTRISSPVSRNLNSGDSIHLLLGVPGLSSPMQVMGLIRYAITLQ